jgi:hypothetical protein
MISTSRRSVSGHASRCASLKAGCPGLQRGHIPTVIRILASDPLYLRHRMLVVCVGTSRSCQELTHAPQQKPYSITSSASNCMEIGTSTPRVFAALRLMTNSNLVDCTTGRSADHGSVRKATFTLPSQCSFNMERMQFSQATIRTLRVSAIRSWDLPAML